MKNIFILFTLLACITLTAQTDDKKWDVNHPPGDSSMTVIKTNEGTWMSIDVSPDGENIVFDMLGDIFMMPIAGGKAKAIRSGLAWEVQPRFSPNGKHISFTSDAGGGDNIWYMKADGSDPKQITKESFRLLNNATWHPNGQYLVARKHFTSSRSLGAGEMWQYHITGGEGMQITKRKNDQQDVNEPVFSPDGRYLYYSEDVYPGGFFQYNKDPNDQIFVVNRYDMKSGKTKKITGGPGGACRPQISNNGKKLAYVRRVRTKSVLFVHDLATGRDYPIFDGLSKDQQEAWTVFGIYTGFDWMPDDKNIVIWGQGKIHKVNTMNGYASEIPFEVEVEHKMMKTLEFQNAVDSDQMTAKVLRDLCTSPDGKTVVFNALGSIWKAGKKGNSWDKPKKLTNSNDIEAEPSFSPDGKNIVFVSWNDESLGAVKKVGLEGGNSVRLTSDKGMYRTPSYSPNGRKVIYKKEGGNGHMGYTFATDPGIYELSSSGGKSTLITTEGDFPMYTADGKGVYLTKGGHVFGSIKKSFHRYDLEKKEMQTIFNTSYTTQFTPSPDNQWIAFSELYKVYIAPMPSIGQPIGLSAKTKMVPVSQVARDAGINLHWSGDSKELHWTLGNEYFTAPLRERFLHLDGAVDSIPPIDSVGQVIELVTDVDKPQGIVVFTNARIITMDGDKVIENGSVVVTNNKITYVGEGTLAIKLPKGATSIDLEGKTIMPGLIDVHAHLGAFRGGVSPQKHWQYYTNLAYGVTTTHDPSVNSEITFAQSEMVRSGKMIGPRIYSTGTILYGADGDFKAVINNLEDARSALRRTKAYGAFSVKSYNQPRRAQRQQVVQAAREIGIRVVPEGGSFFHHNLTMVADGHTSVEHNIPVAPLYDDVIQFWSSTNTSNTPTLIVNYAGVNGEFYWYQKTNVWEKERLLTFTPRAIVDSRSRHRMMIPNEEYENGHILTSKSCTKLQNAGVNINLGAHGQLQGLGAHWELWMLEQGGMTNMQALRAATMNGAEYLGMETEIGSIKEGKLADLIIIDGNPLKNIQDTENVTYTMINGRLYDASTMNEIGNKETKRTKFFWELEGSGNAYPFYQQTQSFMRPVCHCRM